MLEVGAGNYGQVETQGMVNVPVSDQLALRAAFQTLKHDGYVENAYFDADKVGARLEAQWNPADKLSVFGEVNYAHDGGHGTTATYYPFAGIAPWSLGTPIPDRNPSRSATRTTRPGMRSFRSTMISVSQP